jgi:hypothetical protein
MKLLHDSRSDASTLVKLQVEGRYNLSNTPDILV